MDLTLPEYAYMFGFLQADGHLAKGAGKKGRLTVEISAQDVELLHRFQRLTPFYSSITERSRSTNFSETHSSATWSLYSLEARTRLNELGLPYGRKSMTISPPHGEFVRPDYLRGILDADGSVGYTAKGFPFVSLTTASTAIGAYLCRYAREVTGAERTIKRNTRDGVYNVMYAMEAAQRLAAHLYYPGCLALQRKRIAADSLASWQRPAGMRVAYTKRTWTAREDRLLLELNSPKAAAEKLGRTAQSCNIRLWRLRSGQVPMPTSDQ
ncbi:LAGLIDADG family homing endonuclease [Streptomyces heilongjiangensis]|uniref:LAGLIDADG family homing endonuclease n=1 Tax=Streptomyces heilongjiangensis TaxID=945052 RepID=A0ABW1BE47_9ACTN|nr:LAGLIDADG family homing endonuclease [Streptomyces heilongjiangensis]MDC2951473.1 LAGLIDADG family homing endonuclease [Streptomyces heilongjiangensis]